MNISIHGSRILKDERVKIIILEEIEKHNPDVIITHAEPDGVCGVARKICHEKAIPLKLHFLNFKYLRGAFEHRSRAILLESDFSVFMWDGKSKGCSNEIKMAEKMKLPFSKYVLEISEHESSVGFPVENEWPVDLMDIRKILEKI